MQDHRQPSGFKRLGIDSARAGERPINEFSGDSDDLPVPTCTGRDIHALAPPASSRTQTLVGNTRDPLPEAPRSKTSPPLAPQPPPRVVRPRPLPQRAQRKQLAFPPEGFVAAQARSGYPPHKRTSSSAPSQVTPLPPKKTRSPPPSDGEDDAQCASDQTKFAPGSTVGRYDDLFPDDHADHEAPHSPSDPSSHANQIIPIIPTDAQWQALTEQIAEMTRQFLVDGMPGEELSDHPIDGSPITFLMNKARSFDTWHRARRAPTRPTDECVASKSQSEARPAMETYGRRIARAAVPEKKQKRAARRNFVLRTNTRMQRMAQGREVQRARTFFFSYGVTFFYKLLEEVAAFASQYGSPHSPAQGESKTPITYTGGMRVTNFDRYLVKLLFVLESFRKVESARRPNRTRFNRTRLITKDVPPREHPMGAHTTPERSQPDTTTPQPPELPAENLCSWKENFLGVILFLYLLFRSLKIFPNSSKALRVTCFPPREPGGKRPLSPSSEGRNKFDPKDYSKQPNRRIKLVDCDHTQSWEGKFERRTCNTLVLLRLILARFVFFLHGR